MTALTIPTLETERLALRAPQAGDLPAWTAFLGSERARFVGGPLSAEAAWRVFATIAGHWLVRGYGAFVLTLKGSDAPIGWAGAWHPADWPACELTYSLWSATWEGRGLAGEGARAARDHLMGTCGLRELMSYVNPANTRSARLAERLGAVRDHRAAQPPGAPGHAYRHALPAAEVAA